ncbi:MAG TPA: MarR family transcriptional regulator [Geobacteraceae bacterium]|nr:MarR family transcriptional regulator [Geobacteraceae bacterium]
MFDIENSLGFLLAKSYQRGYALFKAPLENYHLTPKQFSLLAFLWKQDGLSQVELSEKCQIDRTTIGGLIDRLQTRGYVRREPHPEDRRAFKIRLTDTGRNLEKELLSIAREVTGIFTDGLTPVETETLRQLLEKLRR